ncbi:MAG TPA: hypothetical protein VET87_09885 [Rubrivivax sp.]|nr:hypothetical protein [Rubrivivax sp.]
MFTLALSGGMLAGAASALALAWRGRVDNGLPSSGINAPSHWILGDAAIYQDGVSLRHTLLALGVHQASSMLWSTIFGVVRQQRRQPTTANALSDAVAVTALAAWVDLRAVPHRLTPGFQERLSTPSLSWVYGSFAAGLALAGIASLGRDSE